MNYLSIEGLTQLPEEIKTRTLYSLIIFTSRELTMLDKLPSTRNLLLLIWVGVIVLISIALYMQYVMELIPCALCMTQRVFVIAVGIVALLAWLLQPQARGVRVYSVIGMIMAIIGGAFSSRHIWLQSLPEDLAPACGPSLSYLLETVPFFEALRVLLQGDGNCAESVWSFLGLTIPGWTLVAFIGLFLTNIVVFYKSLQR
ncbi:MAG: disulfide bond formation protein B [Cellvibrionaceae bacterium]